MVVVTGLELLRMTAGLATEGEPKVTITLDALSWKVVGTVGAFSFDIC